MKKLFLLLAVIALVMGCTEPQPPLFREAWQLIEDRPDSAKAILEKVNADALTKGGRAEYGLLKTIVAYKTQGKLENDSLISASIDYYDHYGDDWHRSRAYLYRGAFRMFRPYDMTNSIRDSIITDHDTMIIEKVSPEYFLNAIKDFKTAEAIAEDADDEKLKNRVYELLAYANTTFEDNPRILKYSHKLLDSSIELNDSVKILRSLFLCASTYIHMGRTDSASVYIRRGIELAKHADTWLPAYKKYSKEAEVYLAMGDIKGAENYLKEWEKMKGYQTKARSLIDQGQYEKAVKQAKLGLKNSDQHNRLKCWEILYEIYQLTGNQEQASLARKQIDEYNDLTNWGQLDTQMVDWQQMFDDERQARDLYLRTAWLQGLKITSTVMAALALAIGIGMWWHRKKVCQLNFRLDEDAGRIAELRTKIEQQEKSGEENGQKMARLKEELESRMEHISGTLLIGTQMYSQLQQRQCIAQATAKELQCLVDYFAQLRPKRWQEWQRKYRDLSTAQYVFLIMQDDLRYDDEAIASALDVKRPSVRSMRSRIKGRER